MRIKIEARGLTLNGEDVPLGTVLNVQGRIPAGWEGKFKRLADEAPRVAVAAATTDAADALQAAAATAGTGGDPAAPGDTTLAPEASTSSVAETPARAAPAPSKKADAK
jgi:hypothetical protein